MKRCSIVSCLFTEHLDRLDLPQGLRARSFTRARIMHHAPRHHPIRDHCEPDLDRWTASHCEAHHCPSVEADRTAIASMLLLLLLLHGPPRPSRDGGRTSC